MQGSSEYMFVAGLVAGMGIAARQAAGSAEEQKQWQVFLTRLRELGAAAQRGEGGVPAQLEQALEGYAPAAQAVMVGLSSASAKFFDPGQTPVESDEKALLNVMSRCLMIDADPSAEERRRTEAPTTRPDVSHEPA